MADQLKIGDRFQVSGKGVEYPFSLFWYEVTGIDDQRVTLKIVDPPATSSVETVP
jgi:hypothetical protein